ALLDAGAILRAYDPEGMEVAAPMMPGVEMTGDAYAAAADAEAVVIITEWNIFRALDLKRLANIVAAPILIDLRNIYPPEEATAAGFTLYRVGSAEPIAAQSLSGTD